MELACVSATHGLRCSLQANVPTFKQLLTLTPGKTAAGSAVDIQLLHIAAIHGRLVSHVSPFNGVGWLFVAPARLLRMQAQPGGCAALCLAVPSMFAVAAL